MERLRNGTAGAKVAGIARVELTVPLATLLLSESAMETGLDRIANTKRTDSFGGDQDRMGHRINSVLA